MTSKRKRHPGNPALAVMYLRASTTEQHLSPEAQRADIERWASTRGVTIAEVYEDKGVSGAADLVKRTGLLAALDAVGRLHAGILVAAKRDRFARDVLIMATVERLVERHGAVAVAVDDSEGSRTDPNIFLQRAIKDAFAEYERLMISARTRAGLAVLRARGQRVGGIPLGMRVCDDGGKVLLRDAGEAEAVARIVDLRTAGSSIRGIAAQLNDEGRPARGRRWHHTSVARVLQRVGDGLQETACRPAAG